MPSLDPECFHDQINFIKFRAESDLTCSPDCCVFSLFLFHFFLKRLVSNSKTQTMTGFEWMLLVLLSVVWGGSFFFNGIALREFPTLSIVTARVGLAALALLFLMKMLGQGIQLNRQILKAFFGMSFLNNVVPFSLIVWGQQHIASGVASVLNATTPLFTMLVAHWFTTDEKINPRRLHGVLTGMGGVGLMMGLDSMESSGFHLLGQSAILLAAFSYGLAGVYGKRFAQ